MMFANIECLGSHWVCFLDEPFEGNNVAYAGDFDNGTISAVTGSEEYWS